MRFSTRSIAGSRMLLLSACAFLLSVSANAQQKNTDRSILSIERNKTDNTPVSITFAPGTNWKPTQQQDIFKKYLGVDGAQTTMVLQYSTTTKMNVTSDRYIQYIKGIRTEYGTYTLMSKNGRVDFITGNYYTPDNSLSATPSVSEASAFNAAVAYVGAEKYMWQDAASEKFIKQRYGKDTSYMPHGQLEWIEDYLTGNDDRKLHLAWSFDIYAVKPVSRQKVFIDAVTGKVLHANSLIKHTATTGPSMYSGVIPFQTAHIGAIYELFDSTRGNGVHTQNMHNGTTYGAATDFTTPDNVWPDAAADTQALDAHWGGEIVYDYWKNVQGRLSWDNLNGILLQYVHYDASYDNAFWDGTEMNYGDGSGCAGGGFTPLTSLDVTAHEIGHGVCQATCNLIYSKESGGIDEGFSDCWGATIENWGNPHEVDAVPKQTWWIGEEIGCGTPLRRLDSPKLYGLPDTYLGTNWYSVTTCTPSTANDQCGVHTNMGVISKWYYLLTVGASGTNDLGNTYTVAGQGFTISENILYQTELILASNATYPVLRTTSINAATTLYGPCSAEVQAVTDAWYAVGVGAAFVPCTPQIGFVNTVSNISENAATLACPASTVINIPVAPTGPAITGGTPVINIIAVGGTAVAGVDYTLGTSSLSWAPGDVSTHNGTINIFDNGAVNDNKTLKLAFTLTAAGSDATISPTNDTMTINIYNNDSVPELGQVVYPILNSGTLVTSNLTSAFTGLDKRAHEQFLLYASELTTAGVVAGAPISQIAFNITTKNSTGPFTGYTISMANTTLTDLSTAFATGLTGVYTGNHTTNLGMDSINFTTNFVWDGVSNVAVNICYGANATAYSGNDKMDGIQETPIVFDNNITAGAGSGCGLAYNTATQNTARPVVRFKQTLPPSKIETVLGSTHTWDVHAGQEVYFYNTADTALIAGLNNVNNDLGCVTATVTGAGVGFTPAVFSPINRSKKEVTVTPTINGTTTTYDATMYLTNTELAGVAAGTLFLVKTDEPTDATITASNSIELTPTLVTGSNYVGFKGTFTGFSRFFLVDGPLCNPPVATATPAGPTTFCVPGSVLLNANTGAGLTYQWLSGTSAISGATNATYTATTGGNYSVIVYTSGGTCSNTSSAITVTADSVTVLPISGSAAVCVGQTTPLNDASASGVWSTSDNTIATVDASGNVAGITTGTVNVYYAVTDPCGTATDTMMVTVNPGITVGPINGIMTLCAGTGTTLTDTTSSGTWSSSNMSVATIDNITGAITAIAAGTATINYSVTTGTGCVFSSAATFTVNALPSATIAPAGPSVTICTGGTVTFSAPAGTGLSYQWQNTSGDIAGATDASFTTSAADDYDFVITDGSTGCAATSASVTVTLSTGLTVHPAITISSSLGAVLCVPAPAETFTANPVHGGPTPVYQWSVNGSVVGSGSTYTYVPTNGDIISCLLTSDASCTSPDTVSNSVSLTVTLPVTPSVSISSIHGDTACAGDTVVFSAVPVDGGTAPTFLWTENGINVATGPEYIYAPHNGDSLMVTMTSNYPCLATPVAVSNILIEHVDVPTPNILGVFVSQSAIAAGLTDTFTAVVSGAGTSPSFQWYINGVPVAGATGHQYITDSLENGQIVTCKETSDYLCSEPNVVTSGGFSVIVYPAGVNQVNNSINNFTLLPNPNSGSFTVRGTLNQAQEDVDIIVTDMLGQTVYKKTTASKNGKVNEEITLSDSIASGIYLVSVTTVEGHVVFHVTISK